MLLEVVEYKVKKKLDKVQNIAMLQTVKRMVLINIETLLLSVSHLICIVHLNTA